MGIHYPVFNPQDPRHNPVAANPSFTNSDYPLQNDDSLQQKRSFPGRSLQKARSGLSALTSGIQRRATNYRDDIFETWRTTERGTFPFDNRHDLTSQAPSSVVSTKEDNESLADAYRTQYDCCKDVQDPPVTLVSPYTVNELRMETSGDHDEPHLDSLSKEETPITLSEQLADDGYDQMSESSKQSSRAVSGSVESDSSKENIPQITDIKLATEPLSLFDQPVSDNDDSSFSSFILDNGDGDSLALSSKGVLPADSNEQKLSPENSSNDAGSSSSYENFPIDTEANDFRADGGDKTSIKEEQYLIDNRQVYSDVPCFDYDSVCLPRAPQRRQPLQPRIENDSGSTDGYIPPYVA